MKLEVSCPKCAKFRAGFYLVMYKKSGDGLRAMAFICDATYLLWLYIEIVYSAFFNKHFFTFSSETFDKYLTYSRLF